MSKKGASVINKSLKDDSLTSLFQQLLGTDKPAPEIVKPKYVTLAQSINMIVRILQSFNNDIFSINYPDMKSQSQGIDVFVSKLQSLELGLDIKTADDENVVDAYLELKNSKEIGELLDTCKNLIQNKSSLDSTKVDVGFVDRLPGLTFYPFSFSSINLKELWVNPATTMQIKKYIITVCKVMYKKTHKVYETVTGADIDVDKFSELIINSIKKVKKMIPRCDQAFSKIEKSVDMLKSNFGGYYKDFIQTQDPTCIMHNFVYDVASQDDVDAKTTFQFRKIIAFYQKRTQGKIKDPRIKKVFDLLGANMKILEGDNVSEIKKMEEVEAKAQADEAKAHDVQSEKVEPQEVPATEEPTLAKNNNLL
jgi:hypothetical protein